jgi:8-oxo-dGTP diphosphatase
MHGMGGMILLYPNNPMHPINPGSDGPRKHVRDGDCCRTQPTSMFVHVSTIIEDSDGRILFVREAKQSSRNRWNLPGGHMEDREHPSAAAVREVLEETLLDVTLGDLIGVYNGVSRDMHSIRFVYGASSYRGEPVAGDEILEVQWMTVEEILAKADDELVGPVFLRRILSDWQIGRRYPLAAVSEL